MADSPRGSGVDPVPPGKAADTDLAGLGEICRTLLTSVADAIGVFYRPSAIRDQGQGHTDTGAYATIRRAKAEAQAWLIADGAAEVLERRVLARLRAREIEKQDTLERTLYAAVNAAESGGSGHARPLDDHWTHAFIDHAQKTPTEWQDLSATQSQEITNVRQ